ncbi:MAG: glycosyltransferase family 39 protein [Candidatus Marinimicrobia bacterium]|nr:glycosyltransferase family 39 protein [Candidatus Neomarinimicrobiota bacterium]MCF7840793.1 glycosyltransferase family 39 protein [Candidatus Neomarinimicrobiota bacterium]MCF7902766.1 glycosyltransferase family 39 protein [Candidatus Neomarinimicrobiota bacterium]
MNLKPNQQPGHSLWQNKPIRVLMLLHIILLFIFIWFRLIDGDEAIFLRAGHLVQQGQSPYFDFFYMQMPYLPWLLALFLPATVGYGGFIAARCVAGIMSLVLAFLISLTSYRITQNRRIALMVYFLAVFSGLMLTWQTTVKTQVFSDFFGILAFMLLMLLMQDEQKRSANLKIWLFISGALAGVAMNIRLTHALLLVSQVLIVWIFWPLPTVKRKWLYTGLLILGVVCASLGSVLLFFKNPTLLWLHNVTVHQRWGIEVVSQSWLERVITLVKFFGYPQTLILFLPVIFTLRTAWFQPIKQWNGTVRMSMSALMVVLVFTIFFVFVIQPVQVQYFEQVVPFLLLGGTTGWFVILEANAWRMWCAPLMAVYLLGLVPFLVIFLFTIRENDESNNLALIRETAQEIRQQTQVTDTLLSANSILPMFAQRSMVKGMEVDGRQLLRVLPNSPRKNLHLLDSLQFVGLATSGRYPLIVYDTTQFHDLDLQLMEHYTLLSEPASLKVLRRRADSP